MSRHATAQQSPQNSCQRELTGQSPDINDALTFQGTGGTLKVTVQNSTFTAARVDLFQIDMHASLARP